MKFTRIAGIAAILTAAGFAQAQDVKVNILTEFWYTQMMDSALRNNATIANGASKYYGLDSRFQENTFNIKRAEIYCSYKISDDWSANMMLDPSLTNTSSAANSATTTSGVVLQDLLVNYTPKGSGFFAKAGQFKVPTTYESAIVSARDIIFFDRAQLSRLIGEKRDRGMQVGYAYGDAKGLRGTVTAAISNGSSDDGTSGKTAVDNNAAKDYMIRYDGSYSSAHKFGGYYRTGLSNIKYLTTATATLPAAWTAAGVTVQNLRDNADKTSVAGIYYAFNTDSWHFDFEYGTGLVGRRFPTLFTAAAAPGREHMDQKFAAYEATLVYKMGRHQIAARYDVMNYNSGNDYYGSNPYSPATGAYAGSDLAPKFTETVVGYNYLFVPNKYSYGKLKLDLIMRGKNFLAPDPGSTSITGGNTLMASVMVGF